jgi:hydroxymethylglutaryl-CoA lyase
MNQTDEVYKGLAHIDKHHTVLSVLTPNLYGYRNALAVGVREIAVFSACSEEFTKRNINCSIEESLRRYRSVCEDALQQGVRVRGYISCVLGESPPPCFTSRVLGLTLSQAVLTKALFRMKPLSVSFASSS